MDAKERLACVLQDLDVKAPTLAKSLDGVSYQNLLDVQTGRVRSISNKVATAIVAKYPQYDLQWLLTGDGSMLKEEQPEPKDEGFWQRLVDGLLGQICQKDAIIERMDKQLSEMRKELDNIRCNQ